MWRSVGPRRGKAKWVAEGFGEERFKTGYIQNIPKNIPDGRTSISKSTEYNN